MKSLRPDKDTFGLCALVILACALVVSTYRVFGHTWDEPEHLSAGMELLDRGVYTHDIQHPGFARMAIALGPYLDGQHSYDQPGPSGEQEGRDILYKSDSYERTLTLARLGVLPFFIVMMVAVWMWARRWFGPAQGVLAVFFLISAPAVLGHAGIAALDIPGSSLCVFALYWLFRWIESSSLKHALLFGLTAGLAVGSKLYAIPYLGVCIFTLLGFGMLVTPKPSVAFAQVLRRERWVSALAAVVVGVLALIVSYGGRFETLRTPGNQLQAAVEYATGKEGWLHDAAMSVVTRVPMPLAAEKLVLGVKTLEQHNKGGHLSYLMGELSATGWKYFYPVDLAIKTPLPLLLFGVVGLVMLLVQGWRQRQWLIAAPALCFIAVLTFCALYSHINIGIRHVLILYPFMAIAAADLVVALWERSAQLARIGIALLLAVQTSVLWTAFPDYFAYFNTIVGRHPENFVVDSDLDWGQDFRRLQAAIRQHDIQDLWLAYRGTAAPWAEKMPRYRVLPQRQPVSGWVAISLLAKIEERAGYAWLDAYQPVQRVGVSIDLYFIPPRGALPPGR